MHKRALDFRTPLLNAAGSLGFAPDRRGPVALDALGAFVTNPISRMRRKAAQDSGQSQHPEGLLLHSGWPNPGLTSSLKRFSNRWVRAHIPIIVHLMASEAAELRRMVSRVEGLDNVMAIELGLPPDSGPELAANLSRAALGEVPLIVQLPFESALDLAEAALEAGADALSLAAKRGSLELGSGNSFHGRLYGAARFDEALETVSDLCGLGVPVIGSGGVYSAEQARRMLAAGAIAVQLDTVLWKADTDIGRWELEAPAA